MSEFQVARAGAFDDIPIYALADGSRLKIWDGPEPPDPALANLWLDPADEILKRYDASSSTWTDAGIVGATGGKGDTGEPGESIKGDVGAPGERGPRGVSGERGPKGAKGDTGDKGLRGLKGDTGERGPKGDKGDKGDTGERGIKGERGPRGYSVLSGARDPEPEDGRDNDFWINTQTALIFGPKTDGEWGQGASLRGPIGPRGLSGSPGPGVATGGVAGQLLSKIDTTDYNTEWVDAPEGTGGGGVTDHGALTGLLDDDHPQYHNDARGDARYPLLAHEHDHNVPLDEDAFAEADFLTVYPDGISIMLVTAGAAWNDEGAPALVRTERNGTEGWQEIAYGFPSVGTVSRRTWDSDALDWSAWDGVPTYAGVTDTADYWAQYEISQHIFSVEHRRIRPLSEDEFAEADFLTVYPDGISIMPVTAGADWGPITGVAGRVITNNDGTNGDQTFYANNGSIYTRVYTSGAWGSWSSGGGSDAETLEGEDGAYYLDRVNHTGTQALATITGHDKAAHDALDIDADTLDGIDAAGFAPIAHVGAGGTAHANAVAAGAAGFLAGSDKSKLDGVESGATADQTASEILTAVKTVDGTGSGLDADLLDGHDTAFFAAAGAAPTAHAASHKGDGSDPIASATTSVAGLESAADKTKLDGIESGATADQTAAEILTAIKTVDGSGSGLDADTLDGHDTAFFAASGAAPTAHAPSHTNGTDDIQSATAAQKGLATAAQITKLDGIETAATADQTPSEILTALLTVDGTGTGLDADLVDGQHASAFLTSAFYQTVQEDGTSRAQRATVNFTHGLDATDNTTKTDVAVDESELTHNSLGGLTTGDPHTQYHNDTRGDARYTPIAHVGSGGTAHANAIASGAAGFLTGTDKAKLDGIEAAATADQTPSEILSALLTVDGTGSLLDADKLDGQEGTYYTNASNLASGTAPPARLGSGTPSSSTVLYGDSTWGTLPAASLSLTEVETNLGTYAARSGSFQITGLSGLTTGHHVLINQASGPYTGKGNLADEAEMDQVSVTGKTISATAIQCYWTSPTPVVGNFKFAYAVG